MDIVIIIFIIVIVAIGGLKIGHKIRDKSAREELEEERAGKAELTKELEAILDKTNKKDKSDKEVREQEAEINRVEMDNNT